jgi:hypothetical protein
MMEPFQFLERAGNKDIVTVSIFLFVSNSNDVTVILCLVMMPTYVDK